MERSKYMTMFGAMGDFDEEDIVDVPAFSILPPTHEPPTIVLEDGTLIAQGAPLVAILGPCVIESEDHCLRLADTIQAICMEVGINFIFKSSFDKANRSSVNSYRGPGLSKGLDILSKVKRLSGCPVLTDVHEPWQVDQVAQVVDIIQIPAFLCRQTDLLLAASKMGKPVNIKKAQFAAPEDMKYAIEKIEHYGNTQIIVTERGSVFGYNNLIVDMRSLAILRGFGYPVCLDATHSTQKPGGGPVSRGNSEFAPLLARAGAAVGIDVLFMEVHNNPSAALSDGTNQLPIHLLEKTLMNVKNIHDYMRDQ
jgi:2-dehydro-3-deoxyphosphooctonate aldolase (KDO 8-P synthase)